MSWDPSLHYKNPEVAASYDRDRFHCLSGRVFNALEKYFVMKAFRDVRLGARVLDCPCGTGRLAEVLLRRGLHVVGVDISEAMLSVAQQRLNDFGDRFSCKVMDVRKLPDEGRSYDVALCARVLMHFPLDEQTVFLKAIADVTRETVVFTHSLDTPYQRTRRRLKKYLRHPMPVRHPINEDELTVLLTNAGLKERRRLRPMPLITEEIIVVASH